MKRRQLRLGLTGGIGSGKTAASDWLEQRGIRIIDADIVAREVVLPGSPALQAIASHFGKKLLDEHGALKRAMLRECIFKDQAERLWLEKLLHPLIRQQIEHQLGNAHSPYVVLSSPLLLETDQHLLVDQIAVVDLPETLQLERACLRDANSQAQIKNIMTAQHSRQERLSKADIILDNSEDLEHLYQQLEALHNSLLRSVQ